MYEKFYNEVGIIEI